MAGFPQLQSVHLEDYPHSSLLLHGSLVAVFLNFGYPYLWDIYFSDAGVFVWAEFYVRSSFYPARTK